MISTQLLNDLGYKGAIIVLSEDWRGNRHIRVSDTRSLCGIALVRQDKMYNNKGRFLGYKPGSYTDVYGFYGVQRCKKCLARYLQHRQSDKGKVMLKKAEALRLKQAWDRKIIADKVAEKLARQRRARSLLGLPQRGSGLHN